LSDGDFQPRFSPDGTKLAFVRTRDLGTMDVLFTPIPGGDPVTVTDIKQPFGDVDWTPDSGSLVFSAQREGRSEIHRVAIAPVAGKATEAFVTGEGGASGLLQFSSGRQTGAVVWAHAQPDENIWRATLTPTHEIAGWERLTSQGMDFSPVYSPDSRRIAFLSYRTGDQQLWITDANRHEREVTFGQLKPGTVSWTAEGDEVVFPSLRQRVLYRLRVHGGRPVQIQVGTVGSHTAVSPGGDLVYFVRRFLIMQAPSAGGQPSQLTDEGGFPLRLSPDGKWIYYVRDRYSSEIWRLRRSDGSTERVTNRLRPGCWACWSVSNRILVYVPSGDSRPARLERLDLISGQIHDLGQLPGRLPPLGLGMVALSPNDSALAVVVAEPGKGELKIAENTPWSHTASLDLDF
jgi:Tol biopolymer transport system component